MKVILIGSGGCMRELAWQIFEQNERENANWQIIGFVDKEPPSKKVFVNNIEIPYLGNDDYLLNLKEPTNVVLTIGSPILREKIVNKIKQNSNLSYPNIFLSNVSYCKDLIIGEGCVISENKNISTNVILGNFVFINMENMICHDCIIEDFVTISPSVKMAGAVKIGRNSDIGIGSKIIQGISIGSNVVLGAGSIVIKDIEKDSVAVGIPAKKIKGR